MLYTELASPPTPYIKRNVRVTTPEGSREQTIVETGETPQTLDPDTPTEVLKTFTETTCGAIFSPLSSSALGSSGYEWALNFVADCDLAQRKTGSIASALVEYADDLLPATISKKLSSKKRKDDDEDRPNRRGAKRKRNSVDLLERYKDEPEAVEWIKANAAALDAADFVHDDFRDKALHDATHIDELAALEKRQK